MSAAAFTLSAARQRLDPYTRPSFALLGTSTAAALEYFVQQNPPQPTPKTKAPLPEEERFASIPLIGVGVAGVVAIATPYSGLKWLAHGYERWAWTACYGGLSIAGAGTLLGYRDESATLLAPSAGAALAATAGERLGSTVGRVLFPALTGVGLLSAIVAKYNGDWRGERAAHALQACALALLPALQLACLPVYTLSMQGAVGCAWLWMAAALPTLDDELAPPEATRQLLLSVGAASILRTMVTRRPICQF